MRRFTSPLEPTIGIRHYLLGILIVAFGLYVVSSVLMSLVVLARIPDPMEQLAGKSVRELGSIFSKNEFFLLNMIPFAVGLLSVLFAAKVIFKRPFRSFLTARSRFDFKRFFFSFSLWAILTLVSFFITFIDFSHELVWNFQSDKFFYLLLIAVLFVPIQTGFEEVFFRGFLLQFFGKFTQRGIYLVLINGILFGILHAMNPEIDKLGPFAIGYYIISGLFTTLITVMDDGLELSWGFHLANNLFGIVIVSNDWQVIQTDALFMDVSSPVLGWDMYVTMFLFYPLMILVFWLVYRWKNWNKLLLHSK
ncbi:CAAX amino terminal protease self- immunity [compost metagenome]